MQILNSDFLTIDLPNNCVDLIITSPPYNIGIDYGTVNDSLTYKDYLEFTKRWLSKCHNLIKDNSSLCINVPIDTGKDGIKRSIATDITVIAKKVGFNYKGTIIWDKQVVKNKYALVFSSKVEVILIFTKKEMPPLKEEFHEWIKEIWRFTGENPKRVNHPVPFPVELPRRLIKLFSKPGDMVLDPFMGSGTSIVAAQAYNRDGLGIEINKEFYKQAKKRIEERKL